MSEHDDETLGMARAATWQTASVVQVALNRFWKRYGEPSPEMLEKLRVKLLESARATVDDFFGASV